MNNKKKSTLSIILNEFKCQDKIDLNTQPLPWVTHLGACEFNDEESSQCNGDTVVAVACLSKRDPTTTTTPKPNLQTIAPVSCDSTEPKNVRLIDGTDKEPKTAGRVEIRHPDTNVWGTICANGFGINEAKAICRTLCTSDDNLAFAIPLIYTYAAAPESTPIHLTGLDCPENAKDFNECNLGLGWGRVEGCQHSMDVGVQCAYQTPTTSADAYEPDMKCAGTEAIITYSKSKNPNLQPSMITLNEKPEGCKFNVIENDESVIAKVPLDGCGGIITESTAENLHIKFTLTRNTLSSQSGVITSLPKTFTATCIIERIKNVKSDALESSPATLKPVVANKNIAAELSVYSDIRFQNKLSQPINLPPGKIVYVQVKLNNVLTRSKIILESCWATDKEEPDSELRQDLIKDKCVAFNKVTVIPISDVATAFSFPAFYLAAPNSVAPTSVNIYIHCQTRMCDKTETSTECMNFCTK